MSFGLLVKVVGSKLVVNVDVVVRCSGCVLLCVIFLVCVWICCKLISVCLMFLYSRKFCFVGEMCGFVWVNRV